MPKVSGGSIDAHRRLTRQRIFDAFWALLYERGYDAITPDDYRDSDLEDSIEVTETFVLRALGVRLGPNGRPRRQARAAT
jgi:hypothetical protein